MRASDLFADTADHLRAAGQGLAAYLAPTVRVGVTGLSRSGKSVFITALVRNLIEGGRLQFFTPEAEGRIVRAYLEPQPDDAVPRFDYETHLAALYADPPTWPEGTRRISQLRLTIEYVPAAPLWRIVGTGKLHIDIVDYPGEWLLDLAMMGETFESWSAHVLGVMRGGPRAEIAKPFLTWLAAVDPQAPADEAQAIAGAKLYTAYLKADRAHEEAQATEGPGRFLLPGELEGSPLLTFFPADVAAPRGRSGGTMQALLARRFDSYLRSVVEPFFRDHFARLDRQIVLVDALGAVNRGGQAMADLERALTAVMKAFRPGEKSWLALLTGRRIDKLLFAATKADHLHQTSHQRLEAILKLATDRAAARATTAGATVNVMAIASVRATREGEAKPAGHDGPALPVVAGVPMPGERIDGRVFDGVAEAGIFPGDLPSDPQRAFDATAGRAADTAFLRFRPPRIGDRVPPPALPHIHLDRALQFLIGDKLA